MRQCPHCNKELDMDSCFTRDENNRIIESKPRIGDVSICAECGEFCEFGPDDTLLKITDKEKMAAINNNPDARLAQRAVAVMIERKREKEYIDQVHEMAEDIKLWTSKNPSLSPMIQRNSTSKVGIIATLAEAIKNKFVSVNGDAAKMLREIGWLDTKDRMPTVFMAEAAIELAFKNKVD